MKNYLTLPITYKALIYSSFGRPSEVLKVTHLEMPRPSGDEVLVKMLKASINPSDLLTIKGTYASRTELPKIAGFEGVGIVKEVGNPDNDYLIGKRVLALKGKGTWQEYNIVPAYEAVLVPQAIDDNLAAQLYINPLTCYLMLKEKLNAKEGDVVLINAGNSACGQIIFAFSKIFGFELISIVRREESKSILKAQGIEKVINSTEENIVDRVLKFTNGKGASYVLDSVGGKQSLELLAATKSGGLFLQYGLISRQPLPSSFFNDALSRNIKFEFFHLREWVYSQPSDYRQKVFNQMIQKFIEARINIPVQAEYDIEDFAKAMNIAELPNREGKILLNFDSSKDTLNATGQDIMSSEL